MQVKKLLTDDEGVSPVIGVILMVAITVILAAVIAAFVLGIGDTDDPAPSANINYEFQEGDSSTSPTLTLNHNSGDSFAANDVVVTLTDGSNDVGDGTTLNELNYAGSPFPNADSELGPGDSAEITDFSFSSGASNTITIELIWAPGGGDAQSVFSEDEFRNAAATVSSP